jgi:uncharacterized membrane protein
LTSKEAPVKKIRTTLLGISLFYLGLYIPVALMTYFPHWYTFNCKLHPRCNYIGYPLAQKYIDELTGFFLHKNDLIGNWTGKEKLHLAEVRDILDFLAVMAIISIVLLIWLFNRSAISKCALVNMIIILSLLLLLPFFKTFWLKIFHPLFFDNDLWKNNYRDCSYYIMPRAFFKHSIILMVSFAASLNGILWLYFKKYAKPNKKENKKCK